MNLNGIGKRWYVLRYFTYFLTGNNYWRVVKAKQSNEINTMDPPVNVSQVTVLPI
jgi:hypothetical protein